MGVFFVSPLPAFIPHGVPVGASVRRRMEQLTGLVMIGFGMRLALQRR